MLKILRLNCYYDKIKSFFDISCDNNREWRPTWTKKKKKLNAKTFGTPFHPNYGCNSYRGREDTSFHGGKINRCHGDNEVVSSAYYQDLLADSYI